MFDFAVYIFYVYLKNYTQYNDVYLTHVIDT